MQPGSPLTPPAFQRIVIRDASEPDAAQVLRALTLSNSWATASASPKSMRSPSTLQTSSGAHPRRGRPRPRSSPARHKSRPPEAPPTFRAGLRPAFTLRPLPLHSQRPARARALRPALSCQALDAEKLSIQITPVQLRPLEFCPFPTPRPLSRPVGPPQPSASAKETASKQAPHAQSLPQHLGSVSPSVPKPRLSPLTSPPTSPLPPPTAVHTRWRTHETRGTCLS